MQCSSNFDIGAMEMSQFVSVASDLSPESFGRFAEFITHELGIKMSDSKMSMVQSRLLRRVRHLQLDGLEQYVDYFFRNNDEREHFINAITTNKTDFFREPEHFAFLTGTVLPSLLGGASCHVKLWSAGCSSGEEPYTLAMVVSEFARQYPGLDFSLLATDVSTLVLDRARSGVYSEEQVDPIPEALKDRYLLRSKDPAQNLVRVVPALRQKISFHRLNFMDESYRVKEMFDVIFFRNVMIYFDRKTQESVVNKLCQHLVPGGYLFVGHSESLAGMNIPVRRLRTSIFQKPEGE
jgi:chemotaxis protein methyltransferase CheR